MSSVQSEMSIVRSAKREAEAKIASLTKELEDTQKELKYQEGRLVLLVEIDKLKEKIVKLSPHHFQDFWKARVRVDKNSDNQVSVNDMWRSYRYWFEGAAPGKKLTQVELLKKVEEVLDAPQRPLFQDKLVYKGVFVFMTEEEGEEYDQEALKSRV